MVRRVLSESGFSHIASRSAGGIALFEDDNDRRYFLRLLRAARDKYAARIIAWVLMTDHVHLVADFGEDPKCISDFMRTINHAYATYFNTKTGRTGTLFQGEFWSKPIHDDVQLVATVYYVHQNPQRAGLDTMRSYRWSSYQEYRGMHWVVDTSTILDYFGSFEAFDKYEGSEIDAVKRTKHSESQDAGVLKKALELANMSSSSELRLMPREKRNRIIVELRQRGATVRQIARVFGIGTATVSRALKQ